MVKKTMEQIAAIKKAKQNKDTSQKLAIAIQLHPRGDFEDVDDFNSYKRFVQGGLSAREAWKEDQKYLNAMDSIAMGEDGPYDGPFGD